jgi:hypothetical protein
MRTLTIQRRYARLLPVALAIVVASVVTIVFALFVLPADDDPLVLAPSELDAGEVGQLAASPEGNQQTRTSPTESPEAAAEPTRLRETQVPRPTRTPAPTETSTPASSPTPAASPTKRPPAAADNLVSNAGFSNNVDGWYTDGQTYVVATAGRNDGPALRFGPSAGYADQQLTLEVGKSYRLQAWGKVAAPGQSGVVGVQYWDVGGNRLESSEPAPLTFDQTTTVRKSVQFTFPDNVARVVVYLWNKGGLSVLTIDDVSVREIINPGEDEDSAIG